MIVDDIALTLVREVGAKTAKHLVECFGSAAAVFAAPVGELIARAELRADIAKAIASRSTRREAEKELAKITKLGIQAIAAHDTAYPALLRECDDHPHVIYLDGDPQVLARDMITIAGTRDITPYGKRMCEELIAKLAALHPEVAIVSGLSYGISAECHRAALRAGVPSVAVLIHGLTSIYPSAHTGLARDIVARGGALLTEFPTSYTPNEAVFHQQARLLAGLTAGTVIVEAPKKEGGALHVAEYAAGYYRTLMAVPGRATDRGSVGTNFLIKTQRAALVASAWDILREMGWECGELAQEESPKSDGERYAALAPDERGLLTTCFKGEGGVSIDKLGELSGMTVQQLSPILLNLEFAGFVRSLPGNRYEKI